MRLVVYSLIFIVAQATAQSSGVEFFSEAGENFFLIINGVRKNATATTNVKVTDLSGDGVKARIIFEKAIPELNKYIMLTAGELTTFSIKKNKNGEYVLRMVSSSPLGTPSQPQVVSTSYSQQNNQAQQTNSSVSTTTTTNERMDGNVSINMNISANGVGANATITENQPSISMSINAGSTPASTSTSTTVTSSSYTSSSSSRDDSGNVSKDADAISCSMTGSEYNQVVASVKSKSFADVKLTVLKQAIKGRCISAGQVKSLADLLSFEDDKLDFAKFAYDYTSDKKNYYRVNDTFAHESTIDDLNEYLEGKN